MLTVDCLFLGPPKGILPIIRKLQEKKLSFCIVHFQQFEDVKSDIAGDYPGPGTIRGARNIELVQNLRPDLELKFHQYPSLFYKDKGFFPFTGRKSSMPLLEGEEFFIQERAHINQVESNLDYDNLDYKVQEVLKITKVKDNTLWNVLFKDGSGLEARQLIFAYSPHLFYSKFELNKSQNISEQYHKAFKAYKTTNALAFHIRPVRKFNETAGTVFIPQDQTKSLGHIIADIDIENQDLRFFSFLDAGEENPKVLMDKIKLIKRKIRHVYPALKKEDFPQKLWLLSDIKSDDTFDEKYKEIFNEHPEYFSNLFFIGMSAPLINIENSNEVNYFARSVASIDHVLQQI